MFIRKKIIVISGMFFLAALGGLSAADGERPATRRLGIFIGSNNGGRDRTMLRYAVSDAKSVSRIFASMGGISETDNLLLVEPTVREINRQLDSLGRISAQARRSAQRTELVFYYSGHSDENGILLNRESYSYRELRQRVNNVQADMRIIILDSCSSGAITRAKGGTKTQPFLFDSSVSTEGYAILTSSSANETSQESDSIESSFFTHSLLAGLRGAADSVGDGRVTLNELYRFAYAETLSKTETSIYGAQHPSYDIQISGSGDVVLTDIKEISASLLIAEDLTGRISIRDSSDFLVAELTKVTRKPMELGLEPGQYRITLQRGDNFYRTDIFLAENKRAALGMGDFQVIASASGDRGRGDGPAAENDGPNREPGREPDRDPDLEPDNEGPVYPLSLQIIPGIDLLGHNGEKATNNFLIAVIVGLGHNINGIGAAAIGQINTGYVRGVQASGIFNFSDGYVKGVQGSGIFNFVKGGFNGIQGTGYFNYTGGSFQGIQGTGSVNYTGGNFRGIQGSGAGNFTGGDFLGLQGTGVGNCVLGGIRGIQAAGVGNYSGGVVTGLQAAGIGNLSMGSVQGIQAAGIFNYANELQGAQAAGIVNINRGGNGAMFGLVNISQSEDVVPFGLVNVIKNGILRPSVYIDDMLFTNFSFRSGSKHFYSIFSFGFGGELFFNRADDRFFSARAGFGFEYAVNKLFFDIDLTGGSIVNRNAAEAAFNNETGDFDYRSFDSDAFSGAFTSAVQLRLTVGFNFFEHFGVFGGISYDYFNKYNARSPVPADFGGLMAGRVNGPDCHKLGIFAGIQY